ncbi:GNAT family N-acetyltransferase [Halalkalibacter sp. APA_J-10(15)]|uniref:GNAT family N-acetyltransferase n=1 Tax=unclassified Halalkalibacter TaxID=2893063 RepID=UPI001FF256AD|nr:GNAT family N-acetyltransferase [Halalkalibacter sp. APA_J-10(15)]MCK0469949.1 GNAT family N-acetyltransferase [Halalkalibacter sp. APA_J-10(15)]
MKIEKAIKQDVDQIVSISKRLLHGASNQEKGFLIRELKQEVVHKHIDEFYVARANGEIAGYLWLNKHYPADRLTYTKMIEEVALSSTIYVKQVAVDPLFARRGVATKLYEAVFSMYPHQRISACIATKPLNNTPSIRYHEKLGFTKVGSLVMTNYLGFDRYEADVFIR